MKLAAIDIGSNSIHLVIVRAVEGQRPEIIDREKEMVRLGAGTLRQHRLSKRTIERALVTLRRFKKMAEHNGANPIITTATSAVRESRNSDAFIERVRDEVGLEVQVLPGVEEARLIALAVSEVTEFNGRRGLIIDIGGGSTEFIVTNGVEPELLRSAKLGAVRLTEQFISTDPVSDKVQERLKPHIRAELARIVWEIKQCGFDFVIGTSGTILNLVTAVSAADSSNGVDDATFSPFSQTISTERLAKLNRHLLRMDMHDRGHVTALDRERADIIVAGGLLLETILSELNAKRITSCDWSLREGVILDYLRRRAAGADDSPARESNIEVRTGSVLSVAKRYNYDAIHANQVANLALQIFDQTGNIHRLSGEERKLLEYGA